MNIKSKKEIDEIGMNILQELQFNARSTFSEIGRKVGLSSPAVAERVYKMEKLGIINGYHADVNSDVFFHNITAFITITTQSKHYPTILTLAENNNQFIECHHISGDESLIIKVVSSSMPNLDKLVDKLSEFGETKTSIVLSSMMKKKVKESIK
jgi:Lrp/AsnC family transcriptional regulator, leucine-responsive regulatory protein